VDARLDQEEMSVDKPRNESRAKLSEKKVGASLANFGLFRLKNLISFQVRVREGSIPERIRRGR
jgi:hypothetical protein